jgi:DNA-binding IclR family transcriptional regulator
VTSASIVTHEAFRERLAEISRLGYVVEYGEAVEGVIGVAAPIRDYSRRVVAAVGVALVAAASDSSSIARTVEAVRSAADSISAELGYVES